MTKHGERDTGLPKHREMLLKNAMDDLTGDGAVLAVYLGGSLAKKNFDNYSDIDLHTIVKPGRRKEFIENKRNRAEKWGTVLFHEGNNPLSPVIVTHYDCFVKVDSWYHALEELTPSIWLKGVKVLYDPANLIHKVVSDSSGIYYEIKKDEVEFWKGKVAAFVHETYRAVMRKESYHAEFNVDRIRWLVVSGWYMEMDEHFDAAYGSWSKVEGERSILKKEQLFLLKHWRCGKETDEALKTVISMVPEILRLNQVLSKKAGVEENSKQFKRILEMGY